MDMETEKKFHKYLEDFYREKGNQKFVSGQTPVQYAGAVFDHKEIIAILDSLLGGWFGLGRSAREFESNFSEYIGAAKTVLTNSGSSATLLAVTALTAKELANHLERGDEVITPAMTFPTTINPVLQNGLKPVILDVELGTYNINPDDLENALTDKTKLIFLPHAFGVPNEMDKVMKFANDNGLYVIEDNCDALGSTYKGKKTGSFGTLSTCSFYPAHHMTMGEGGAVSVNKDAELLSGIVRSFRDWGRACYCAHDEKTPNGACGKRFDFKIDGIPYDHRYVYTHMGYNLKPLELQAAMGLEQLKRLSEFVRKRRENFDTLYKALKGYEDYFILPKTPDNSEPSWFCFPLTLRDGVPFQRRDIVSFLEQNKIQTRLFFAGNVTRQPAYKGVDCVIVGDLKNSDKIMKDSFFVGVYPGIDKERMDYMIAKVDEFMKKFG